MHSVGWHECRHAFRSPRRPNAPLLIAMLVVNHVQQTEHPGFARDWDLDSPILVAHNGLRRCARRYPRARRCSQEGAAFVQRSKSIGGKKPMSDAVEPLILDLLERVAGGERPYAEVMDAWHTSCPKLPVWEDANDRGLIRTEDVNGRSFVRLHHRALGSLSGCAHPQSLEDLVPRNFARGVWLRPTFAGGPQTLCSR
jgi:hypothetical protein